MLSLKLIDDVTIPSYQTEGASGFDLQANSIKAVYDGTKTAEEDKLQILQDKFHDKGFINLRPGERITFGTGLQLADMNPNYEIQIRSRSSVAGKRGLFVSNQPGTIDADYRGEIMVSIFNSTNYLNAIRKKERIAQAVIQKVEKLKLNITEDVTETERGEGGFGSTGE